MGLEIVKRVYVDVDVTFNSEGGMVPRVITWEDGRKYRIDRVLDRRVAAARRSGGYGDRYTILIGRHKRYLFFEHSPEAADINVGRWFLESRATIPSPA